MANWDTVINFNNSKNKKTFTNWNNENPENWRKTNDENCGFKCKLGKSFLVVKESIKKAQDDSRRKKADRYGVSLEDYDKAVKQAKSVGKKKAYNSFLKDVEKKEYLIKPNKGGKSTKSTIDQILDSFAGTQTKPKRRTTKRKTPRKPGKYTVVGGIAYPVATNQSKKRRKQKSKSRRKSNDEWVWLSGKQTKEMSNLRKSMNKKQQDTFFSF